MKKLDVLIGLQWGDEGKGKIIDFLTNSYDIIARFQGGPNAGHTVEFESNRIELHTIPSGIFRKNSLNIIGSGVVIDPISLKSEMDELSSYNSSLKEVLLISKKSHLIFPTHKLLDRASEQAKGKNKIGSTLKGMTPAYINKIGRNGMRVGDIFSDDFKDRYVALTQKHRKVLDSYEGFEYDLKDLEISFFEAVEFLKTLRLIDSEYYINSALEEGKSVLAEGAQGVLLDIDFGTYPFVTSSSTITAGACIGLGVSPLKIGKVFGIFKAFSTRLGGGPFPTELTDEMGEKIATIGNEFELDGTPRRVGWFDLPTLKYSVMISGVTDLCMMKSDVFDTFDEIKICTHYILDNEKIDYVPFDFKNSNLQPVYKIIKGWKKDISRLTSYEETPEEFKYFVDFLEKELKTHISIISVGPDRNQTFFRA